MNFRSEVVYLLRTIRFNILFLFRIPKLNFAECRSNTANSYSVKMELYIYGILCLPEHKDECCEFP